MMATEMSETERCLSSLMSHYPFNGREDCVTSSLLERGQVDIKNTYISTSSHQLYSSSQNSFSTQDEESVPKVPLPRRKTCREEKYEKQNNWPRKDSGPELPVKNYKQQMYDSGANAAPKQYEQETFCQGGEINAILEVHLPVPV